MIAYMHACNLVKIDGREKKRCYPLANYLVMWRLDLEVFFFFCIKRLQMFIFCWNTWSRQSGYAGEQGWRSGESARSPPPPPTNVARVRPGVMCGLSLLLVLSLLREVFSGYSGFPLSSKTNIAKFQFYLESTYTHKWVPQSSNRDRGAYFRLGGLKR